MLEILPNELLLEIFEFLNAAELFRAFHNLNHRFNDILFIHFRSYRVDFYYVLKYQSDLLSRQYLPLIADQVISIYLSDNYDHYPPQTDLFFSSGLLVNQFKNLRSLSLYHIHIENTLHSLVIACSKLSCFTHLKIVAFHSNYIKSVDFSNTIWSLPQLTHFRIIMDGELCVPTIISLSLEYLSISCSSWGLNQVNDIFQQTPHLQRFRVPFDKLDENPNQILLSVPSITILKLSNVKSLYAMMNILQNMPSLIQLKLDTNLINFDGYRWEDIIDNYLPKLRIFHLKMYMELSGEENNEQYVDEIISSFRSRFWLEKHQWYIRCHFKSDMNRMAILLYTLPYAFDAYNLTLLSMQYKSTCPMDDHYLSYDRVTYLLYKPPVSIDWYSSIHFSNIKDLSINLPVDKTFWKIIPTFCQLQFLTVSSTDEDAILHLQTLLNRAPRLQSLRIQAWPYFQIPIIKNIHLTIRRIDARLYSRVRDDIPLIEESYDDFIHSSLAKECEELLIKVKNRQNIVDLINGMDKLRLLGISFDFSDHKFSSVQDYTNERKNVLKWIEDHLPQVSVISKDRYNSLLWIYLEKS